MCDKAYDGNDYACFLTVVYVISILNTLSFQSFLFYLSKVLYVIEQGIIVLLALKTSD